MKIKQTLMMTALAVGMCVGAGQTWAQNQNNGGQKGPGGRGGRGNFDPAQFQQMMMDRYKDMLEVKDDTEWTALQPLVQKVMDARRDSFGGMARGMFGRRNRGGNNADNNAPQADAQPQRRGGMFGTPSPEAEALQKAIDAKASKTEIKATLDKYVAARKAKQADLEKAQDDLRKVLTSRQEAIATLNGLL
jgi:uncharacterized spore protein YtfJ